jgi:hypothetical protein
MDIYPLGAVANHRPMERVRMDTAVHAHIRVGCPPMKLVYKPFSLVTAAIAARLGKSAFQAVWSQVGEEEHPPQPTAGYVPLPRVAASAALEAATMAAIGAVVEQVTARAFHHLVGAWPEKPPEED